MKNNWLEVPSTSMFSAKQTFTCGQCFRWAQQPDGSYAGVVRGRAARVRDNNGVLCIASTQSDFDTVWHDYFDCGTDYAAIQKSFGIDEFTRAAAQFGAGIRILQQEPWEALITFILSQCNNIPRITTIVQRLCEQWGEAIPFEGQTLYTFPSPEKLAGLTVNDLQCLRAGYRAPYILSAAQAAASGALDFETLRTMPAQAAREQVMKLHGVGRKVADCFLLYGLHKLDAFPVDTWIKKAAACYTGDMTRFVNSPYAGVYQQYFFYYTREVVKPR